MRQDVLYFWGCLGSCLLVGSLMLMQCNWPGKEVDSRQGIGSAVWVWSQWDGKQKAVPDSPVSWQHSQSIHICTPFPVALMAAAKQLCRDLKWSLNGLTKQLAGPCFIYQVWLIIITELQKSHVSFQNHTHGTRCNLEIYSLSLFIYTCKTNHTCHLISSV